MVEMVSCMQTLTVALLVAMCVSTVSLAAAYDSHYHDFADRDAAANNMADPRKPPLGLGNLLLKNLRFRDIMHERQMQPMSWMMKGKGRDVTGSADETLSDMMHATGEGKRFSKRTGDVSVSELAQILNDLKARNADDSGVKLQSLRFGRK